MNQWIQQCASLSEPTSVAGYFGALPCATVVGGVSIGVIVAACVAFALLLIPGWILWLMAVKIVRSIWRVCFTVWSRIDKVALLRALKSAGKGVAILFCVMAMVVMFMGFIVMSPRHSSYWGFAAILCGIVFLSGGVVGLFRHRQLRQGARYGGYSSLATAALMLFIAMPAD